MSLGIPPQPTAPWRPLMFKVHCVVTQRWMKIRVPFAWFWYGETEYGSPEVESGTIASSNPTPPKSMLERAMASIPRTNDGGELKEEDLQPYVTPKHRAQPPNETLEERIDRMEQELKQARASQ